jgi:uncharacterized protein YndB with AHSA1/START domain
MLIKILVVLAVVVIAFVVVVATRPADFRYIRATAITAPPAAVFAQVNDLHKWQAWSPWAKMDPTAKTTFEGPTAGAGSKMSWDGNSKVGAGNMTITDSHPNDLIRFRLEFLKPFAAVNTAEFTFTPQGDQTLVTWSMFGQSNFVGKAMGLIINCDKMIGGQFEKGLADMKIIVEARG